MGKADTEVYRLSFRSPVLTHPVHSIALWPTCARYAVLTALSLKTHVLWNVMLFNE